MSITVLGGYGGTRQVIRKTVEGDDLFERVQLKDLISEDTQERVLIQMTKGSFSEFVNSRRLHFFDHHDYFLEAEGRCLSTNS